MRAQLIPIILCIGMASPYISIMIIAQYQNILLLLINVLRDGQLHSLSAFMSLSSIVAYIYRLRSGSGALQDSLIITTLTLPVVLPSLLMVGLLITPTGQEMPIYFGAAADLYLTGIASLAIVVPILAVISHTASIVFQKGTPAGAILMTMVTYGLVAFVVSAVLSPTDLTVSSAILQQIGARILMGGLFVIQLIIANVMEVPLPVPPSAFSGGVQIGVERIYTGTAYAIASGIYIYYRLFRKFSDDEISLEQSKRKPSRLSFSNLTSIGISLIIAIAMDFVIILGISRLTGSTELGLQFGLIGMMSFIIIIGVGDSIMGRVRRII